MYCNSIGQSYNSKNTIIKFPNMTPESYSTIRLHFKAKRILNDGDTPFPPKIWPLA
jgi:hypothetical protein